MTSEFRSAAAPDLLPYLPMLYVAWADGELSHDEIRSICAGLKDGAGDGPCSELLGSWLDPDEPPSPAELNRLLSQIRRQGAGLSPGERRSLTELGLELAKAGGREVSSAERLALEQIESALGIAGPDASRHVLVAKRPEVRASEAESRFSVTGLQAVLDGERAELKAALRRHLSQPEFAYRYGLDRDEYRRLVLEWCRSLAAEGYGALSFPRHAGGADDMQGFVAAFATIAEHDLSLLVKFGVQFGLFGGSILQLGTERHHREYLPAVGSLDLPGGFAMSETAHGSNVYDLETVARYDPKAEEFEIHTPRDLARKDYIGNAARDGRMMTVFAQLEVGDESYGVHAFLVPVRDREGRVLPGVRIEDCGEKLGLNGVDNGRIWFDRVRIPRSNLLDRFAQVSADGSYTSEIASPSKRFFTMLGTLVGGRVSVAAAALAASKSALTIAVRYALRRRQFGPEGEPEWVLLDYRTHQRRLFPRLAKAYALDFALAHLTRRYIGADDTDRRQVEVLAAGMKAISTWHATDTIQTCREACGGQGYLAVNRFAALKADTDVFTTFEGDNIVLLQLVAKGLLTDYKRQFVNLRLLGLVRYAARQAAAAVSELNPVITRITSAEHLRSAEFQLAAFRWREKHLLASLARRLKKRLESDMEPFVALVEVQDHAVATARAHVERLVLEHFDAAIESLEDPELGAILVLLRDLFALAHIESDRGWFQEHGYLADGKSKAIRKEVNALCAEVRPHARGLVDAFGIPDALLAAPIAVGSG